jgi:hypothetical protein
MIDSQARASAFSLRIVSDALAAIPMVNRNPRLLAWTV